MGPVRPRTGLLVALLALVSLASYALRTDIAIAQKFMMPDLGLSLEQMGDVSAVFQLAYAFFQIPAGVLGDRFGSRLVLTIAMLGWAVAALLTGLVPASAGIGLTLATLIGARALLGISQAATYPVGSLAITRLVPLDHRGTALGTFIAAAVLGSAITPPVISWAMVNFGWRAAFQGGSVAAVIVALLWFWLTPVKGAPASPVERPSIARQLRASLTLLRQRDMLLVSLAYAAQAAVFFVFVFWFFIYLTDARGFSVLKSGLFGAVPYLVAAVIGPLGGVLTDQAARRLPRFRARRLVAVVGLVGAALCVAGGAMLPNAYAAIAALSLSVGLLNGVEGPFWATATEIGGANAGAAGGVLNFMGNLGGAASIWAVPRMVTHLGWTATLGCWALVAVAGAGLWFLVRERP